MNINRIPESPVAAQETAQKEAGMASSFNTSSMTRVAKDVLGYGTYLSYAKYVPGISNICNPTHLDYVAKSCGAMKAGLELKDKIDEPIEPPITLVRQAQKVADVTVMATKVFGAAAVLTPLIAPIAPAAVPFVAAGVGYANMVGQGAAIASVGLKFLA